MRAASTHLALPGPSQTDFSALENRVDPGVSGAKGQLLRHQGGSGPVWASDRVFDARDDGVAVNLFNGVDQAPNILAAMTRAGWNTGESGGTLKSPRTTVQLPSGVIQVGSEIATNMTWNAALVGAAEMTRLQPIANLNSVIYWDGVGDGSLLANLYFASPSTSWVAQDVIRVDRSSAVTASVHNVHLRNITVGDTQYVRGISIGRNSATNDMAQIWLDRISIQGAWTTGNVTTYQEALHLGSSSAGNVLNFAARELQLSGAATVVYLDSVNATLRDVYIGSGGVAFGGSGGRFYLLVDGCRVESCNQFCNFTGVDATPREFTFRNINYSHNLTTTSIAANFDRAGDVIFENVYWSSGNYPTTHARMSYGGSQGRVVTFRNFVSKESPSEIWNDSGTNWKNVRFVFQGYTWLNASSVPQLTVNGLFTRAITASSNFYPYDGIIQADATSGNITVSLPTASKQAGREAIIWKTDAGANTVGIAADGTDTLIGNTAALSTQNGMMRLLCTGAGWIVTSRV